MARGSEKGERHPSSDEERVHPLEQRFEHSQLVGDLRTADHRHERTVRCAEQLPETVELPFDQEAGGARQAGGRPDDRGMTAVRDAEGVVHVGVVAVDQLLDEGRIVVLLARVEAKVLEQLDLRSQAGELFAHRADLPASVGCPLRATEVGARGDRPAPIEQVLERRQRSPDPEVVGDLGVTVLGLAERDVEVHPHQDARPAQLG